MATVGSIAPYSQEDNWLQSPHSHGHCKSVESGLNPGSHLDSVDCIHVAGCASWVDEIIAVVDDIMILYRIAQNIRGRIIS